MLKDSHISCIFIEFQLKWHGKSFVLPSFQNCSTFRSVTTILYCSTKVLYITGKVQYQLLLCANKMAGPCLSIIVDGSRNAAFWLMLNFETCNILSVWGEQINRCFNFNFYASIRMLLKGMVESSLRRTENTKNGENT